MDFRQLLYFVTAVEEGSISAAARKLFLSQPPVTAQIKALEEELGCTLLVRGARAVRMTEEGRLLYDRAKAMLALRESAAEEIAGRVRSGGGTLRLGVVSSVAGTLLPGWLAAFHREKPRVVYELSEENTYHLLDMLRSGLLEVALVRTPFAAEGLEALPLQVEELVAAGRREHLPPGGEVALEDLAQRPLLLYRRWEHIALRLFAERGLTSRLLLKGDGANTIAASTSSPPRSRAPSPASRASRRATCSSWTACTTWTRSRSRSSCCRSSSPTRSARSRPCRIASSAPSSRSWAWA